MTEPFRPGLLAAAALACAPTLALADGLAGSVGGGFAYHPREPGGSQYQTTPVPFFDLSWNDRLHLSSTDGLSFDAIRWNGLAAGPFADMAWGRDGRGRLAGLRDVPDMADLGGFVDYAPEGFWQVFAQAGRAVGGGHGQGGLAAQLGGELDWPLTDRLGGATTLSADLGDARQLGTFFGVDRREARRSDIAAYRSDGGFQDVTLSQGFEADFGQHWAVRLNLSWIRLVGPAADSTLVRERGEVDQGELAMFLAYRF